MARGTIKWFDPSKGLGLIRPEGGGGDVFVRRDDVRRGSETRLTEGQSVTFEPRKSGTGKVAAGDVAAD